MTVLAAGNALTGLIMDGVEETPWTTATLSVEIRGGVVLEVPFVSHQGAEQFATVEGWFRGTEQPRNLAIATNDGTFTLIDCHYSPAIEHRSNGLSIGRIRPQLTVSSTRDADLHEPLVVAEVRSRIDGLLEWTSATSFQVNLDLPSHGPRQSIDIEFPEAVSFSWRQGTAVMKVDAVHSWQSGLRSFAIQDEVFLTSLFEAPVAFDEHLAEQGKVSALITILNGAPAYFRQHQVRDAQFPEHFVSGDVSHVPFQEMISRKTFRDSQQPQPSKYLFRYSLSDLETIGQAGLESWSSVHDTWKRAIEPLVALFRRRTTSEDALLSTCVALEAAGHLLGSVPAESETYNRTGRPTTATYIYRCLAQVPVNWAPVAGSMLALSRAIANTYNDIKHFDRQTTPDPIHLDLICQLTILVARISIVRQIDVTGEIVERASTGNELSRILAAFGDHGLFISETGQMIEQDQTVNQGESP